MNSEKEEQLLKFLAEAGFAGEELERQIKANINLNAPRFSVPHRIPFGDEIMFFDLKFQYDFQFDSYRLEKYIATHRAPVHIDHQVINEIDTAQLEQKMSRYDWDAYFANRITDPLIYQGMSEIRTELNRLPLGQDFDGIMIQEQLMFKYWSPEDYQRVSSEDLYNAYGNSRDFVPVESGICNVNLAYHIVSDRLNDLYEKLSFAGLDNLPGLDLHAKLEEILSGNPQSFDLNYSRNTPEGLSEFIFAVTKIEGYYAVDTYSLTVTPYPEIQHGDFGGINTRELEAEMHKIDWNNDRKLFIFREDAEPDLFPSVRYIADLVHQLSDDKAGVNISEMLQLKYWQDAVFFSDLIKETTWHKLEGLPKRIEVFPIETDANIAKNLMYGRTVMNGPPGVIPPDDTSTWLALDLNTRDQNGHYPVQKIEGFSKQDVTDLIHLLPVGSADFYPLRNSLLRGDISAVTLTNDIKVLLQANPEQRTIDITTPDGRPIPFNFRFDPDWKPVQKITQHEEQKPQEKPQKNHFNKINKPRKNNHGRRRGM